MSKRYKTRVKRQKAGKKGSRQGEIGTRKGYKHKEIGKIQHV